MKHKLISMLTSLAAVVLLLNLAAIPGLGFEYTPIGTTIEFDTQLEVKENANIPAVTFSYTIEPGDPVDPSAIWVGVYAGAPDALVGTAEFKASDTYGENVIVENGKRKASKKVTVTFPSTSFTKPGVYRYKLKQIDPNIAGLHVDSQDTRYIDIFVTDNDSVLQVSAWEIKQNVEGIPVAGNANYVSLENKSDDIKSDGFENSVTQSDFTYTKAITGNQGDKNKKFLFKVETSGALPGEYNVTFNGTNVYSISTEELIDTSTDPQALLVDKDGVGTYFCLLKDGSSVTVQGLNEGAEVTVTEDPEDYTPSWVTNSGGTLSGATASKTCTVSDANITVNFTNNRNGIVPSGLFDISFVPYLIPLVIIIIVYVVVMIKKRKNNDDDDDDE